MSKEYQFIDTSPVNEVLTYREIAEKLNLTHMEVVRIEKKALKKIRKLLIEDPRDTEPYGRPTWLPSIYE